MEPIMKEKLPQHSNINHELHEKIMNMFGGSGYSKSMIVLCKEFSALMKEYNMVTNTHEWHKYRNLFNVELVYKINLCL